MRHSKMTLKTLTLAMTSAFLLAGCNSSTSGDEVENPNFGWTLGTPVVSDTERVNSWFNQGAERIDSIQSEFELASFNTKGKAKNIILFVGDGMGISTLTAGRILEAQTRYGMELGEEHQVVFEKFPHTALSKTYNSDATVPDSAGTMNAMMTGVKNRQSVIGLDENVWFSQCDANLFDSQLISALDLAKMAGKSTGIVTTTAVTHATPAATYAFSPNRNWETDTSAGLDGCIPDIAKQLIDYQHKFDNGYGGFTTELNSGMDVIFGGGRSYFTLNSEESFSEGDREDEDLIELWKQRNPNGAYIQSGDELANLNIDQHSTILGLFAESQLDFDLYREDTDQPSLSEMTSSALELLQKNEDNGFFLMVEGGRIDHGHHFGSSKNALYDFMAFNQAIETAVEMTKDAADETLIIVTADHSHVFTIGGKPKRGNHILDLVHDVNDELMLADDGLPFTALHYANGLNGGTDEFEFCYPGYGCFSFKGSFDDTGARKDPGTSEETMANGYAQQTTVPLPSESHAGEDVGIWAIGPGSEQVRGVLEQNSIFHIMERAGNLIENAEAAIN
ncbi:alkaline phosphatase [Vibrio cyclitrophicus]|nr:alkaline phosphatase [Vibrio cyclitrophicus]